MRVILYLVVGPQTNTAQIRDSHKDNTLHGWCAKKEVLVNASGLCHKRLPSTLKFSNMGILHIKCNFAHLWSDLYCIVLSVLLVLSVHWTGPSCYLWWSLVIKATDGAVVDDSTEVRGSAGPGGAGI